MLYKLDGILFFYADNERHAFKRLADHFGSLADGGNGIPMLKESAAYIEQEEEISAVRQFDATGGNK